MSVHLEIKCSSKYQHPTNHLVEKWFMMASRTPNFSECQTVLRRVGTDHPNSYPVRKAMPLDLAFPYRSHWIFLNSFKTGHRLHQQM